MIMINEATMIVICKLVVIKKEKATQKKSILLFPASMNNFITNTMEVMYDRVCVCVSAVRLCERRVHKFQARFR